MKEYMILMTKYNRNANGEVVRLIEGLSKEERAAERKSFYGSLYGLLDHLASGALVFQTFLKPSYLELSCLSHEFIHHKLEHGKINFPDFSELKRALITLDDAYVAIAEGSSDEYLNKPVALETPYGTMNQTLVFTLLRYVTHCTHHRGQVSQILDEMGIPNDYSRIAEKYD